MTNSDIEYDDAERRVIQSIEEIEPGMILEIPAIRRIGSKSWVVDTANSYEIVTTKLSGSSGELVSWDQKPGASTYDPQNRTVRELVEDGEVTYVGDDLSVDTP